MENQVHPTLLIADDHNMLTKLFENYFRNNGYNVVGTVKNGKEVLNLLNKNPLDLVLMDYDMPIMNGIVATRLISKTYPSTKVLMLSMFTKPAYIEEALDAGAKGYISKESNPEEIEFALNEIIKGNMYLSPKIASLYLYQSQGTRQSSKNKLH